MPERRGAKGLPGNDWPAVNSYLMAKKTIEPAKT
jgi:hypothetical protein